MKNPIFITGNQHKADYLNAMLGVQMEHRKIDLDEIQSTSLDEIVEHKVKQAYSIVNKPVLVEDVSLSFTALQGLPGPFVKFFVEANDGLMTLCKMLDSFDDRSAVAACVFGYYDGKTLQLMRGSLGGAIATEPRGNNGFGWDAVFEPNGYGGKTRAEMSYDDNETTYKLIKPFQEVSDFLRNA